MKTIRDFGIILMLSYMLSLNKLKKIKNMRRLGRYIRRLRHKKYVEESVTQLRGKVCSQAIMYGVVDKKTRDLFLKYNDYLVKLNKELK